MKYSMQCTCGQTLTVDAMDDGSAKQQMMDMTRQHVQEAHPDMNMSDADMDKMVTDGMKKEGM